MLTDVSGNSTVLKCIQSALSQANPQDLISAIPSAYPDTITSSGLSNIEITVRSTGAWTASYNSEFASVSPTIGENGDTDVTIGVNPSLVGEQGTLQVGLVTFKINGTNTSTSYSWTQETCFDLESDVLMANGRSKKLKNIIIGDLLSAYSFANSLKFGNDIIESASEMFSIANKVSVEVTDFGTSTVESYRKITLVDGKILHVTPSHPLLASKDGENIQWLLPDDVRSGVYLVNKDGEFVEIESKRTVNETLEIGVLQVKGADNYFVSGVMVHNTEITRDESTLKSRASGNIEPIALTSTELAFKVQQ